MAKFMVLYHSTVPPKEMMASMTSEQREQGMSAWMAWSQKVGNALADFGMPLGDGKEVSTRSTSDSKSTNSTHPTQYVSFVRPFLNKL
ncbi:MAG: hypothetical protein ACYDCC_08860 [Actinomycetota bacterium]